jgi:hypothetical protein
MKSGQGEQTGPLLAFLSRTFILCATTRIRCPAHPLDDRPKLDLTGRQHGKKMPQRSGDRRGKSSSLASTTNQLSFWLGDTLIINQLRWAAINKKMPPGCRARMMRRYQDLVKIAETAADYIRQIHVLGTAGNKINTVEFWCRGPSPAPSPPGAALLVDQQTPRRS